MGDASKYFSATFTVELSRSVSSNEAETLQH